MSMEQTESTREDGRHKEKVRSLVLKTGIQSHASGSASLENGKTIIRAAVYGPHPVERHQGYTDKCTLSCEVKGKDRLMKEYNRLIKTIFESTIRLELYPNTRIELRGVVLENDGSELSSLINTLSIAIADAGIEMFDLVTACHLVMINGELYLDPTTSEVNKSEFEMIIAARNQSREVCHLTITGQVPPHQFSPSVDTCLQGCLTITQQIQQAYGVAGV